MPTTEVRSDIAGKVWKIEAEVGDALAAEDTILILESMKMEIRWPRPWEGGWWRSRWRKTTPSAKAT